MKRSFYIFLSSLLGVMLFILLERSLFLLAFLLGMNVLTPQFAQIDYIAFIVASILGLWYGIWVGLYWYTIVYEEGSHPGMLRGIWGSFSRQSGDRGVLTTEKTWDLEDLMQAKSEELTTPRGPRLEVFESNTVAFTTSTPVHADSVHAHTEASAKKRVVRKSVKKAK